MVGELPTLTSPGSKPVEVNINYVPAGTFTSNSPLALVVAKACFPFLEMVTPASGVPLSEVTLPVIVFVCDQAVAENRKQVTKIPIFR